MIGQVNPFQATEEEEGEKRDKFHVDEAVDCHLVKLIDQQYLSPHRNLAFVVAGIDIEFWVVFLFLPVDKEVVGGGGNIVDQQHDREQHEDELYVKEGHEGVVIRPPVSLHVWHEQIDSLLELIEAEAVGAWAEQEDPHSHCPILQGHQEENQDHFEEERGVIGLIRVVLDILVEAEEEEDEQADIEDDERSSQGKVKGVLNWGCFDGRLAFPCHIEVGRGKGRAGSEDQLDGAGDATRKQPAMVDIGVAGSGENLYEFAIDISYVDIVVELLIDWNAGGTGLEQIESETLKLDDVLIGDNAGDDFLVKGLDVDQPAHAVELEHLEIKFIFHKSGISARDGRRIDPQWHI